MFDSHTLENGFLRTIEIYNLFSIGTSAQLFEFFYKLSKKN